MVGLLFDCRTRGYIDEQLWPNKKAVIVRWLTATRPECFALLKLRIPKRKPAAFAAGFFVS